MNEDDKWFDTFSVNTGRGPFEVSIYINNIDDSPFVIVQNQRTGEYYHPTNTDTTHEYNLSRWSHLRDLRQEIGSDRVFGEIIAKSFAIVREDAIELCRSAGYDAEKADELRHAGLTPDEAAPNHAIAQHPNGPDRNASTSPWL